MHARPVRQAFAGAQAPALVQPHPARAQLGLERPGAQLTASMAKKDKHVSATPATEWLREHGVAFTEHVYEYV